MNYADFTDNLEGQRMFQILAKAKELESNGNKVIHLEIGDPDFNSPKIAKQTLKKCLDRSCKIIQLTSDKTRENAVQFYEKCGFVKSHEGFKLTLAG